MAHQFESGFFVSEPAWHGLGTVVEDAPNTADAIRLAGLDWTVESCPVFDGEGSEIDGWKAQTRSDNGRVLGVTRAQFKPLQNHEAFAFFDYFLCDGDCSLESAGALQDGKTVWILAKINVEADVSPGDRIDPYFLLSNGHAGNLKLRTDMVNVRVVCNNTLSAALGDSGASIAFMHRSKVVDSLMAVRETVDLAKRSFALSIEDFRILKARGLDVEGFRKYVQEVFESEENKVPRCFEELERSFDGGGPGSDLAGHTLWGAYNAVTDWIDHRRGRSDETRLQASWFGVGSELRERAMAVAKDMV